MVTRVTTAQRFSFALRAIQRTQYRIQQVQEQIATGKRIQRPSDDPSSFAKVLNIRRLIGDSNQFRRNIDTSQALINITDITMQRIRDMVLQARIIGVSQAGAPSDSATRAASAIQVARLRESIIEFANTQVGQRYIFSGTRIFSKAYSTGGDYQGDQGKLDINVAINNSDPINVVGSDFLTSDLDPNLYITSGLAKSSTAVLDEFVVDGTNNVVVFKEQPSGTSVQVTVANNTYTGAALATELQAKMNASGLDGTYAVAYDAAADSFSVTLTAGTPTGFQVLSVGTDAASTGAAVFGFAADSTVNTISTSDTKVAFNVITGVNDTFSIKVDGGTDTTITVAAGQYTSDELATQMELKINNNVKEVTTANRTIKIFEDGGVRSETFTLTAGTKSGAVLRGELETALNASTILSGSTAAGGAGYVVTYNVAADKFTIATAAPAVSVGVEVGNNDLAALMGFTAKSPFGASIQSDTNITGAKVDYTTSFKDRFTITSATSGKNSSIALTVGGNDILATLNLDAPTVIASKSTLLSDLNAGKGVESGSISVTDRSGAVFTVDLSTASTLSDVFDKIEAAVTGVKVSISSDGKRIVLTDTNSPQISNLIVKEVGTSTTAAGLGLLANVPGNITGQDIDPRLSSGTPITSLRRGAGVSLGTVNMGGSDIDLNIGSKITINDLITAINSDPKGKAAVSSDGKHLELISADSGVSVLLTDVGNGTSVRDLGFQGGSNVLGLLATLEEALLRNDAPTIGRTLDEFTAALDRIGVQQVTIGETSRQFERITIQQEEIILSFGAILTKEEDTDLTQAITEFSILQTSLEAAFASTAQILQISLLQFLN